MGLGRWLGRDAANSVVKGYVKREELSNWNREGEGEGVGGWGWDDRTCAGKREEPAYGGLRREKNLCFIYAGGEAVKFRMMERWVMRVGNGGEDKECDG